MIPSVAEDPNTGCNDKQGDAACNTPNPAGGILSAPNRLSTMLSRLTWTKVIGTAMLVAMPVVAPFGDSFGVPRIAWEPLVGLTVFMGLFLLFRR